MNVETIFFIVTIVFLAALLFGVQRQRSHKPIGFGTFTFVSTGSCVLAIISLLLAPTEPLPLLGAIITGIGFLGAGALIKTTDKIFGFTSAASIWLFAVFGLTIGVGQYGLGAFIYASVWVVSGIDKYLEKKGIGSYQKKLIIITKGILPLSELIEKDAVSSKIKRLKLTSVEIDNEHKKMILVYVVEGDETMIHMLLQTVSSERWVNSCKLE